MQKIPEETLEQIALIRKIIKGKAKTISVRNDSGTAWGWVEIRGSGEYGNFTQEETKALFELGLIDSEIFKTNSLGIAPDSRVYYLKKWTGQLTEQDEAKHQRDIEYSLQD